MFHQILTFQPLVYSGNDERFRVTNLGAIVSALKDLGHDAQQVAFAPSSELVGHEVDSILLCSKEQATDPGWWIKQNAWAVIANTWGAPRFEAIRNAILQATPRLVDRLDTDGARSPYICWPSYLHRDWSAYRDFTKPHFRYLAFWQSLGRGIARQLFPRVLDKRLAVSLAAIPIVTAESPISVERMRRFQRKFGFSGENMHLSPFPVNLGKLDNLILEHKKNRVISVGRWDAHQKNFSLLLRVLHGFLADHPDWDAILPGRRHPKTERLLSKFCHTTQHRIQSPGPLPNAEIHQLMADSKIFLMASRHESFGIAAAEALCLGCSVVGPAHIPSVPWFCGSDSGSVATVYTRNGLLDALAVEARLWKFTDRDAITIARTWRSRVEAETVARVMVNLMEKFFA